MDIPEPLEVDTWTEDAKHLIDFIEAEEFFDYADINGDAYIMGHTSRASEQLGAWLRDYFHMKSKTAEVKEIE